jgi:hypothetical protein
VNVPQTIHFEAAPRYKAPLHQVNLTSVVGSDLAHLASLVAPDQFPSVTQFTMRFAVLLALVTTALAGVVPRQLGQYHCDCPQDLTGSDGHFVLQSCNSYQCTYPKGACMWDLVRGSPDS